jgi:murein DD-endopeptidase MepM/ murein hydrolase activator NlpD
MLNFEQSEELVFQGAEYYGKITPPQRERTNIIYHIVDSSDTVSGVASTYGLSINSVKEANGLKGANPVIVDGKQLVIPPRSNGVIYRVNAGDNLDSVLQEYKGNKELYPQLNQGTEFKEGNFVFIPEGKVPPPPPPPPPPEPEPVRTYTPPAQTPTTVSSTPTASTVSTPARPVVNGAANQQSSGYFWPTSGGISQLFGRTSFAARCRCYPGGVHPGVDVFNRAGTPIYATTSGVVSRAGWDGGYGKAVRLNHSGENAVSIYAHMSSVAVGRGQRVSKGQLIGYMGSTGFSTGNHLHFEIRVGGRAVNPLNYRYDNR